MQVRQATLLPAFHPDFAVIERIEAALIARAGGLERLKAQLPILIRQAIDEVIDAPRTGRVYAHELEKTEKTYIGTKVEILVRDFFHLPKGILDLRIDDLDVDVKNTLGGTWMIPNEAIEKPCILVASDEEHQTCCFGIFIARLENLNPGLNQDQKRSVSKTGRASTHWILADEPYPPSFWSRIGQPKTRAIMRGSSGNQRLETLFREVQATPVHRDIVQAVAQQKDYMKRLRKNGGARDMLARDGIALLSGTYDSPLIGELGLPPATPDEFISFNPSSPEHIQLLRRHGKID